MRKIILLLSILCGIQISNAQNLHKAEVHSNNVNKKNGFSSACLKEIYPHTPALYVMDSVYFFSWDTTSMSWLYGAVGFVHIGASYLNTVSYDTVPGTGIGKGIFTYGADNNLISDTYLFLNNNVWENSSVDTFTYNTANKMTSDITLNWVSNVWVYTYQTVSIYDINNNDIKDIYQQWNGTAWASYAQVISTFDVNNNQTMNISQFRDSVIHTWVNSDRFLYTYDANNNQLTEVDQFKWTGTAWINNARSDSNHYYYSLPTGINTLKAPTEIVNVYPNPSNGVFTIKSAADSTQSLVEIYNVLGEQVKIEELTNTCKVIDISSQPSGIYLYRVITRESNMVGQGKLILQK